MNSAEQKAKKVPTIRFAGFDDEWIGYKIADISSSYSGGTPSVGNANYYNGDIPFIRSGEIYESHTELFLSKEGLENSSAKMVEEGDVLYALYGATSGEVCRAKISGAINQALLAIIPKEKWNSDFLVEWFRKEKSAIVDNFLQGGQGNLSAQIIKDLNIKCPSDKEQQKIGSFFSNIDSLISLEQKKYDKLTQVKKSMLEKMFPKEGATVPEIRFAGFTGDWGKDSLDKLAIISKGCQINKSKLNKTGKYYVLNGGMSPSGFTDSFNTTGGTISISEGGNSCGFVMYNKHDFWSGGHNYTLSQLKLNGIYFYHFLKMREPFIMSLRVGSGLPNIQKSRLSEIIIFYPTESEQQKIGSYFSHLDSLISLQQRKLEKLKNIKKSLLEKMFV